MPASSLSPRGPGSTRLVSRLQIGRDEWATISPEENPALCTSPSARRRAAWKAAAADRRRGINSPARSKSKKGAKKKSAGAPSAASKVVDAPKAEQDSVYDLPWEGLSAVMAGRIQALERGREARLEAQQLRMLRPTTVYVGNLEDDISWRELRDLFRRVGWVLHADVLHRPGSSESEGVGLVTFGSAADAETAVQKLQHAFVHGQRIEVKPAASELRQVCRRPRLPRSRLRRTLGASFGGSAVPRPPPHPLGSDSFLLYKALGRHVESRSCVCVARR